jgi:TLD
MIELRSPFLTNVTAFLLLPGQWQRLYSSEVDGRCFNRLEWSLLGYTGPTIMLIKTTSAAILGAYANFEWKESITFRGNSDSFLFQLKPELVLYWPKGHETNFAFLRTQRKNTLRPSDASGAQYGLGFGGSSDKPLLFITESFERCQASFYDKTNRVGEIIPEDLLETFEIASVESWCVGGEETIQAALKSQAVYRKRHEELLVEARVVHDKTIFVKDLQSGLVPSSLYKHQEHARGRADFIVDDEHEGAYKIERDF